MSKIEIFMIPQVRQEKWLRCSPQFSPIFDLDLQNSSKLSQLLRRFINRNWQSSIHSRRNGRREKIGIFNAGRMQEAPREAPVGEFDSFWRFVEMSFLLNPRRLRGYFHASVTIVSRSIRWRYIFQKWTDTAFRPFSSASVLDPQKAIHPERQFSLAIFHQPSAGHY